jgi:hypothetical protein
MNIIAQVKYKSTRNNRYHINRHNGNVTRRKRFQVHKRTRLTSIVNMQFNSIDTLLMIAATNVIITDTYRFYFESTEHETKGNHMENLKRSEFLQN